MTDDKKINLNCPVSAEFAARFDTHLDRRGAKSRTAHIKALIEADMAATVPPDFAAVLKRELAVQAALLLSSAGRTGSTEVALKVVRDVYLSGRMESEVFPPPVVVETPAAAPEVWEQTGVRS